MEKKIEAHVISIFNTGSSMNTLKIESVCIREGFATGTHWQIVHVDFTHRSKSTPALRSAKVKQLAYREAWQGADPCAVADEIKRAGFKLVCQDKLALS